MRSLVWPQIQFHVLEEQMVYGSGFENNRSERWKKPKKRKILQRSKHNYVLESFAYAPIVPNGKGSHNEFKCTVCEALTQPLPFALLAVRSATFCGFHRQGVGKRGSEQVFVKFDLILAYQQLVFDDDIPDPQTIIIYQGDCQDTFLHFGISLVFVLFSIDLWRLLFLKFLRRYPIWVGVMKLLGVR